MYSLCLEFLEMGLHKGFDEILEGPVLLSTRFKGACGTTSYR